jgi:hypothetical protein
MHGREEKRREEKRREEKRREEKRREEKRREEKRREEKRREEKRRGNYSLFWALGNVRKNLTEVAGFPILEGRGCGYLPIYIAYSRIGPRD